MSEWLAARHLLAVRLDNAGDVIMLGPALRAIKVVAPAIRLTLLATPAGTAAAALLPWVDDVITWRPVWQDLGRATADPARDRALIALLAERGFDAAVIFTSFSQTPHVPGYVCYLAGIPLRAGEAKEFGGATLTTELRGAPDALHQVERNLRLVEALGFPVSDRHLAIAIPPAAHATAGSLLAGLGIGPGVPFVLAHPGASAQARRPPVDRLLPALVALHRRELPVVVTGNERERDLLVGFAAAGLPTLAGATSLPVYAALVTAAAVVVCGNTLPLHLAEATGTPLVSLYAGTDLVSQWEPRRVAHRLLRRPTPCTPCYRFDCPIGQPCLDVGADEIVAAVLALLGEQGAGAPPHALTGGAA